MKIRRLKAKTLINSGAIENYINKDFARRINYKKKLFKKLYNLLMFDGTPSAYNNNKITYYSRKVRLQIDGFNERKSFDIIYLRRLDLILGLS